MLFASVAPHRKHCLYSIVLRVFKQCERCVARNCGNIHEAEGKSCPHLMTDVYYIPRPRNDRDDVFVTFVIERKPKFDDGPTLKERRAHEAVRAVSRVLVPVEWHMPAPVWSAQCQPEGWFRPRLTVEVRSSRVSGSTAAFFFSAQRNLSLPFCVLKQVKQENITLRLHIVVLYPPGKRHYETIVRIPGTDEFVHMNDSRSDPVAQGAFAADGIVAESVVIAVYKVAR